MNLYIYIIIVILNFRNHFHCQRRIWLTKLWSPELSANEKPEGVTTQMKAQDEYFLKRVKLFYDNID